MIVDLVRNDLSRVCVPGTVTVPDLLGAEPHPGVWHLVSTVEGTLADGVTDGDLIRAAFPPGSVTGAPKVRALEIIDELELAPREAYTGAIGYRSPVAGLELNVAIRTFEFAAGRCWLGAGGGIVADSDPEAEYAECLIKATPLITAIGARLDVSPGDLSPDDRPGRAEPARAPTLGRRLLLAPRHRRPDPRPGRSPRPAGVQRPRPLRQGTPGRTAGRPRRLPGLRPDRPPPDHRPPRRRPPPGDDRGSPPAPRPRGRRRDRPPAGHRRGRDRRAQVARPEAAGRAGRPRGPDRR